ncbi:uncharacterized protein [Leuresthes tenuis]|uniref:uncharacterized protein n=1 Tax=Leuresthes tenuis TaxID=355514 RepID=UPI003B505FB5
MISPPVNPTYSTLNITSPVVTTTSPALNATSPPVNTTSAPLNTTSPPLNMTSAPLNATSPPLNMTSAPLNTTSPPLNMTSAPLNATSPTVNMTSPPLNATSPPLNMTSPPLNATSPTVNMTSPAPNATSPTVNMTSPPLNATSPTVNMTSPPLNATSPTVNVTSVPPLSTMSPTAVTTPVTMTVTTAAPPETRVNLGFSLQQNFTSGLGNSDSDEFKTLAKTVQDALDSVYRARFGIRFLRSLIKAFSRGSVVVDADLIFRNATSVPENTEVVDALVEAANNSSFTLQLNTSTVVASIVTTTSPALNATSPPVNMTSPALNATSPPVNMTSPALNATSPPVTMTSPALNATSEPVNMTSPPLNATTSPVSMTSQAPNVTTPPTTAGPLTDPPLPDEGTLGLEFRLNRIFNSALANKSSSEFQALAINVTREINNVCQTLFGSIFRRSIVDQFTNGSVVSNMTLVFNSSSSVPAEGSATTQLSSALSNVTTLDVIDGSVRACKYSSKT